MHVNFSQKPNPFHVIPHKEEENPSGGKAAIPASQASATKETSQKQERDLKQAGHSDHHHNNI